MGRVSRCLRFNEKRWGIYRYLFPCNIDSTLASSHRKSCFIEELLSGGNWTVHQRHELFGFPVLFERKNCILNNLPPHLPSVWVGRGVVVCLESNLEGLISRNRFYGFRGPTPRVPKNDDHRDLQEVFRCRFKAFSSICNGTCSNCTM